MTTSSEWPEREKVPPAFGPVALDPAPWLPRSLYGTIRHMKARRAFHDRAEFPDGAIVEMTIWEVPEPVPGSMHSLKYSLFYGYPGARVVGYDNERGKGDHRHIDSREEPYEFSTVEALMADFLSDVRRARGET
ncbi:MAG TPA: DUF6516 family protein [Rhodocyclaceae bacterium]|nr:DUF6516 family protein [Rhodocyclaceae bacterium]